MKSEDGIYRVLKSFFVSLLRDPHIPYLRNIPQIIGAFILWFKVYSFIKGSWDLWVFFRVSGFTTARSHVPPQSRSPSCSPEGWVGQEFRGYNVGP